MKRIFVVPDVHGRTEWEKPAREFLRENTHGTVVFLGDYVDSFNIPGFKQVANLCTILDFKEQNMDNVVLLLGNHDFPYMYYDPSGATGYRCSGYQELLAPELYKLYNDHCALFQLAYQTSIYLFVHAGVTRFWLEHNEKALQNIAELAEAQSLADLLNACLLTQQGRDMLWQVSRASGGYNPVDGPVWVRPQLLGQGVVSNYIQIVGHTNVHKITPALDSKGTTGVILTDCMHEGKAGEKNDFLIIEIMADKANLTTYRELKDKLVGAPGTPEREEFEQELAEQISELDAQEVPVVIIPIEGEGDFIIERADLEQYGADNASQFAGFLKDYQFDPKDIDESKIDWSQTRTRKFMKELAEWGSF